MSATAFFAQMGRGLTKRGGDAGGGSISQADIDAMLDALSPKTAPGNLAETAKAEAAGPRGTTSSAAGDLQSKLKQVADAAKMRTPVAPAGDLSAALAERVSAATRAAALARRTAVAPEALRGAASAALRAPALPKKLPRGRLSWILPALGLGGAGAYGAAVAAPPLFNAASTPTAGPRPSGVNDKWLLGGLGALGALGIGGYLLNDHMKSKRKGVEALDESEEV